MNRAFSFPITTDRSRIKERLELNLAALCELELLKQKQEYLVLSALSLEGTVPGHSAQGDLQPPRSAHPGPIRGHDDLTLRRYLNGLQSAPWGMMTALEQQVGDMKVDTETAGADTPVDAEDSRPSSGFYELSEGQSPRSPRGPSDCFVFAELSASSAHTAWMSYGERPKSVGDIFVAKRDGLLDYIPRTMVPRSFSVPHASLKDIAEGTEEEPWPWDPGHSSGFSEESAAEDLQEVLRVESYILRLIQHCAPASQPCEPHTCLGPEPRAAVRRGSLSSQESPCVLGHKDTSKHLNGGGQNCSYVNQESSRVASPPLGGTLTLFCTPSKPSHPSDLWQASFDFSKNASSSEAESYQSRHTAEPREGEEHLVTAQYIPGQTCQTRVCASTHRPPAAIKPGRTSLSPDGPRPRPGAVPKKCHLEEERPAARKQGRRASRSQSEHSLLGQWDISECKCGTVERGSGRRGQARSARSRPGSTGDRRWCSTQELSQDKAEARGGHAPRRSRKPHPHPLPLYPYTHGMPRPPHRSHCSRWAEESRAILGLADAESNVSEGDTLSSSSLSSDSDDSSGLVWPQEVSPPASAPPKAFMKIKASHALKKKILRFRASSLKVITTV